MLTVNGRSLRAAVFLLGLVGSAVEQVRFAALAELSGLPVPFLQELTEPAALDGEPHLVRPREAVDGRRPGEVARVPTAYLVDEQQRRADGPVRPPVGDGEANCRDGLPLVLGGRRRHSHRYRFEPNTRQQIGRASCRERVSISVVAVSLKR